MERELLHLTTRAHIPANILPLLVYGESDYLQQLARYHEAYAYTEEDVNQHLRWLNTPGNYEQNFIDRKTDEFIIAQQEDQVVGFIKYCPGELKLHSHPWFVSPFRTCNILVLYVLPAYRRQGIATELLKAMLEQIQGQQYRRVTCNVHDRNTPMIQLLRKFHLQEMETTYSFQASTSDHLNYPVALATLANVEVRRRLMPLAATKISRDSNILSELAYRKTTELLDISNNLLSSDTMWFALNYGAHGFVELTKTDRTSVLQIRQGFITPEVLHSTYLCRHYLTALLEEANRFISSRTLYLFEMNRDNRSFLEEVGCRAQDILFVKQF